MKIQNDYDFDFNRYKEDNVEIELNPDKKKPSLTSFRSKFSPGEKELETLSVIKSKIYEYSIKVAANSDNHNNFWSLYGCINTYWSIVSPIFGTEVEKIMKQLDEEVLQILKELSSKNVIEYDEVNAKLLKYRDKVLQYAQYLNLGIEVERANSSATRTAKQKMVE